MTATLTSPPPVAPAPVCIDTNPVASAASTRPIRMLLLLTSTAGGVGQHAYLLAKSLSRQRFDLTVAFGPGYPLDAAFEKLDGCRIVRLRTRRSLSPVSNMAALAQVVRLMRRRRFDVVLTGQSIAGAVGRVAGFVCGVPVRIHGIHAYASHDEQPALKRWIYRRLEHWLDPLTTHYIAVSHATRDFGIRHRLFAPERASVIYNGIPEPIAPATEDRADVRRELGLKPDAPLVATVGRFERQKGLNYFIDAAAKVLARVPEAQFLLIGDGPLLDELRAQAARLGVADAIRFAGWRDDVQRVLAACDVFALASLWEALPLTIAEAMAAARPVVATDVGGVREIVRDGVTGRVVPPRDVSALADAIAALLRDEALRRRFGDAGRASYLQTFTLPRMVEQYERLLTEQVNW